MDKENVVYDVWPEQWYLEIARSASSPLSESADWRECIRNDVNTSQNIEYAWKAIAVISSCLSVEAFCNNRLHRIWKLDKRTEENKRFVRIFGEVKEFEVLFKNHPKREKVFELKERVKTICEIFDKKMLSEANVTLWNEFTQMVKEGRHFFVHPIPEHNKLNRSLEWIRNKSGGDFARIASDVISYLYEGRSAPRPVWLDRNILFDIVSIKYLGGNVPLQRK